MGKKTCVIHANCQGDQLAALLKAHPEFGREYRIRVYVNYARQRVPEDDLAGCGVFLYQWLGPKWGALSSESLLAGVSPDCRTLCVPNLYFRGYWPLCDNATESDYSDRFLNDLADRGLSDAEIANLYFNTDLTRYYDLDGLVAESMEREREKERRWDVKLTDLVERRWKKERLFATVNHPGPKLGAMVANKVLELLGHKPLPGRVCAALPDPYPDFEQPIHPFVIRYFNLEFADPDADYNILGLRRTFGQYVAYYVKCRRQGIRGFSG